MTKWSPGLERGWDDKKSRGGSGGDQDLVRAHALGVPRDTFPELRVAEMVPIADSQVILGPIQIF